MNNEERLNLLKEVAGTSVYERNIDNSKKLMDSSKVSREKVEEFLKNIENKMEVINK